MVATLIAASFTACSGTPTATPQPMARATPKLAVERVLIGAIWSTTGAGSIYAAQQG